MSSAALKLGPIPLPVARTKGLHAEAGVVGNGSDLANRDAPLAPVADRLHRFIQRAGHHGGATLGNHIGEGFLTHAAMVNRMCSWSQQGVSAIRHIPAMKVWDRVNDELGRRRLGWAWLAARLDMTIQRVHNWKARDIPASAYAKIAEALGESVDWVAGIGEAKAQPKAVEAAYIAELIQAVARLSESQQRALLVAAKDPARLESHQRNSGNVHHFPSDHPKGGVRGITSPYDDKNNPGRRATDQIAKGDK